jgi:phosphatidylserine decarboxylase
MLVIISSTALSILVLVLLALKWRVKLVLAIPSGIVIGVATGFIVREINTFASGLNWGFLIIIELALILMITFLAIMARFYRDPQRSPAETEKVILSPADGKVIYVNNVSRETELVSTKHGKSFKLNEITATNLIENASYLVGIDMNVTNVHVNRSPIGGTIVFWKRTAGKFISLRRPESEIVNERVTTIISNGIFNIGVIQIASRLVRKIISYRKEGDSLEIGQRLGAIVFGSQVDVVIPGIPSLRIEVKPGDEVTAGVSVIARYGW